MKEQGYDVVLTSWYGVYARSGTPPDIVDKVAAAITKALQEPGRDRRAGEDGHRGLHDSEPAEFQAFTDFERSRYGEIINAAGIPKS